MRVYDVTLPLSAATPLYPGDPPFEFEQYRTIGPTSASNNSRLRMGSHNGTHIDAPLHFVAGGATLDAIPPEALVGPCVVVDVGNADAITRAVLEPLGLAGRERVLFRTRNSAWISQRFDPAFVGFSADGAAYLAELGPVLIGIDAPSLDPRGAKNHPAHTAILGSGRIKGAIEWLNLAAIDPGEYTLFCGPLNVVGAEGAPCRVFLTRP